MSLCINRKRKGGNHLHFMFIYYMIPPSFGLCRVRCGLGLIKAALQICWGGRQGSCFQFVIYFLNFQFEITLLPCNLYNIIVGTTTKTQTANNKLPKRQFPPAICNYPLLIVLICFRFQICCRNYNHPSSSSTYQALFCSILSKEH